MVFQTEPGVRVRRVGISRSPLRGMRRNSRPVPLSKLAFDKVFASFALVFLAPVIGLIAVTILLTEGGPVFFGHQRVGLGGRRFKCLKFTSMCQNADQRLAQVLEHDPDARAEWQSTRKLTNDPRISALGAVLRKTSLDELPQLWNVLRGDMSIVGPRPIVMDEAEYYGPYFSDYLLVLPGVTGAWQVSGRSDTTYEQRVALDVDYIRSRGFFGDIKIVLKTVAVILKRDGAR